MKEVVERSQLMIGTTKVKHTMSGFTGIVKGVAEYAAGRISVGIQPAVTEPSILPKDEWFSIQDIEIVE